MFWLTDRYGPRLTGSPEFEEAGDWAVKQLQDVGRAERPQGALRVRPRLVAREVSRDDDRAAGDADHRHAEGVDAAARTGTFTADVVRPADHERRATRRSSKGKLRGKIVLTQPAREVRMLDQGRHRPSLRRRPKWMEEALSMPAPRGGGAARRVRRGGGRRRRRRRARGAAAGRRGDAFNVNKFYQGRRRASRCSIAAPTATCAPAAAI